MDIYSLNGGKEGVRMEGEEEGLEREGGRRKGANI